jgi:hypothetical protein
MSDHPVWRKAELLVKETQEAVDAQMTVVADLEKRGLDPTLARKHLTMMEEMLARRIEIRSEMRRKRETKR